MFDWHRAYETKRNDVKQNETKSKRNRIETKPNEMSVVGSFLLTFNCRQCHGCLKKLDNLPQNLKVLQISLRDTYGAPAKKERIISQSKGSLQET